MGTPWRSVHADFRLNLPGAPASTAEWQQLPVRRIPIASLILTQRGTYFDALDGDGESWSGDRLPHVAQLGNDLYLIDGHHRMMRAVLAGGRHLLCRVWTPSP